ncbi:hemagglutinin repeat-containing protein [Pseudomonas sp. Teo4]|uniref:hemagglutinin repeat-containing protein n=1 Tax=Pseudomonas sp. Teo4 TaxID=3064528 RepID=UPI002AB917F3|nr:hemagglutinin repeat-containing protein [Pseudomonas sp. Teo4]MDZ3996062.1 Hemolysin [Pseudomonas sp. Teo4]
MQALSQLKSPRPDTLRWAIFLALLGPGSALAQGGLQATTGPGGTPVINGGHGVPVIDIVAPNATGLSHNQFLDYNVGKPGVVLNNALQAGQSQLAGALASNPQFQGQAASTILNEVVSRNASLIEGPQEIFGRPADYILANPNGITLNGGSFINTTRAGFVVGTPELQEQRLKYLDTLNASGSLNVLKGGQSNREGALDLIAPRLDSTGLLQAKHDLNITVGRNRIDHGSGQSVEHLPALPSTIDASLFGAMRAGRIRVVSTAEGAGVRVGAVEVEGREGIDIRSAGSLQVKGGASTPAKLRSEQGAMALGAADDLTLSAVDGHAGRIEAKAGKKLTLDAETQETIERNRDKWSKKFLFVTRETYNRERTTTKKEQHGTTLHGRDGMALQSGADMKMVAANLSTPGDLDLNSGASLDIEAGIASQRTQETVRHRKDLWRGDHDSDQLDETARASTLDAGRMTIKVADTFKVKGSTLHSGGEQTIKAKQVEVGTTSLKEQGTQRNYRGDLVSGTFFGDRKGKDSKGNSVAGSSITSDGAMQVVADQVSLKGSRVMAKGDGVLYSEKGRLAIEADHGSSTSTERDGSSKLFGLLGNKHENQTNKEQVLISDVSSTTNLRLTSAKEMRIHGAKVEAGKHLQVEAKGDLLVDSAQSRDITQTSSQHRSFTADAKQTQEAQDGKPESRQYAASVGYEVATTTGKRDETRQVASELKGASVGLDSGAHLQVNGSKVQASAGDLTLKGKQLTLGATRNDTDDSTRTQESGGGLTVTGGIDRLGSAFDGHHNTRTLTEHSSKIQRSELQASGDLKIDAGELVNEAARVEAGKTLQVVAKHIENRALQDTEQHEENIDNWRGSLGASVEYRDLTRPIERLVLGEEAQRFQQASPEDAMAAPSVGADLTLEHIKRLENQRRGYAQVSELSGSAVTTKADIIQDQGTAWRANAGTLQIDADQHHLRAAENTQQTTVQRLTYGGDLRVDSTTGSDLNVRASGKGGSLDKLDIANTAVPGSLYGQQGIQVQLGSDGLYEGTRIGGGEGNVVIQSGGALALTQATDHGKQSSRQLDGNAWAKGGNRPDSVGGEARGYLDHAQKNSEQTKAQVAQIDAKGDVRLVSKGDLLLEGTRIGERTARVGNTHLESGGRLHVKAASDKQKSNGANLGGGMELAAKSGATQSGTLGGHFSKGKVDENASQAVDAQITSAGKVTVASNAREDIAVHLQGLQVSAEQIELNASNGGLLVEASKNIERRNNLDITAGAGFNLAQGATNTRGLHGRVKVDLDKRDNQTWNANTLRAGQISLESLGDTRVEGVSLEAGRITGTIGGDLKVASLKDSVDTLTVKADARLSHEKNPQGYTNAASSLAGPLGGDVAKKAGPALSKVEPGFSPTFNLDLTHAQRDNVAQQTTFKGSEGIELNVAGDAQLLGARLQSAKGDVALRAQAVTHETLSGSDYRREVSIDASNSPVDLGTAVAQMTKGKGAADGENALDLGLLRTSGHNRNQEWGASVQGKRD